MVNLAAAPRRAVIADDDHFFRLALAAVLTRHCGFGEVVEVDRFDEALVLLSSVAERQPFDVAIVDPDRAGVAGIDRLAAVRACSPATKIVVLTASRSRRDVLGALSAGVHGYVAKGVGVSEIVAIVDGIFAGTIHVPSWLADPAARDGRAGSSAEVKSPKGAAAPRRPDGAVRMSGTLTQRQEQVLRLLVAGGSSKEIARALGLGQGTVKVHVAALFRAFGVANRAAVAAAGARYLDGVSPSRERRGAVPVDGRAPPGDAT